MVGNLVFEQDKVLPRSRHRLQVQMMWIVRCCWKFNESPCFFAVREVASWSRDPGKPVLQDHKFGCTFTLLMSR